jgi:hypothetical protein
VGIRHILSTGITRFIHRKFFLERSDFAIKFRLLTENEALITITILIYKQEYKNNAIS